MYDRTRLSWHRQQNGTFALHAYGRMRAVLHVVPDAKYPGMWRIRCVDGRLSGMANLSRAKDAGMLHSLALLNRTEAA
jgi:hypothetical protein